MLHGVRERLLLPLVSVPLVSEYEAVLLRPEHLTAAGATEAGMLALIDDIVARPKLWTAITWCGPCCAIRPTITSSRRP